MWLLQNRGGQAVITGTGPVAWSAARGGWETPTTCYADPDRALVLVPEAAPEVRHVTRLAFRNRFLQTEKAGLELASQHNALATAPAQQQAAALRAYLADVAAATYIDLQRPDTRAAVLWLESAGLLGAGRALAILDTPIQPAERPQ